MNTKKPPQKPAPKEFGSSRPYVGAAPRMHGERPAQVPMHDRRGIQNYGTFRIGYIPANSISTATVGPGVYSLSPLSNVPFVSLVGAARQEKVLSWGETIIVREGEQATVKNASYHPGDIVLSAGEDFVATPKRITVPVEIQFVQGSDGSRLEPKWAVDCRRAKSAYFVTDIAYPTIAPPSTITGVRILKRGRSVERAHNTPSTQIPGGYESAENIAPGSQINYVALGYASQSSERGPMALLDIAYFNLWALGNNANWPPPLPLNTTSYYVLEY